jgi:hypothetical protein
MATISTQDGVFTIGYEARADDGAKRHFEDQYTPDARIVFERRLDPLSFAERWREEHLRKVPDDSAPVRHGIFESISSSGLLAFLDQSEVEEYMSLNWRASASAAYSRVAIGKPQFLGWGHEPRPTISEIIHHSDHIAVAWVRTGGKSSDLILTRVSMAAGTAIQRVIAKRIPFTTSVSAANIGAKLIVVRHTAILEEGGDSDVVPYFLDIETAI